jgi:hypothetical protein
LNVDDDVIVKKNGEVVDKIRHIEIKEVLFKFSVFSFDLEIVNLYTGRVFKKYTIAEGVFWGELFKNKRRKEHKRKIRKLFKGMIIKEYKNGKYLKI